MMKRTAITLLTLLVAMVLCAGKKFELKDVTSGAFRADMPGGFSAAAHGDGYTRLSDDGRRIESYSFKTGKPVGVLFDVATAQGARLERIDGYTVSPDGRHILVQTATERIYRHSFTATYYIYNVRNNRLAPLSEKGAQQAPLWSPDGLQVAFVRQNNIFLVKLLYDNAEVQVTKDGRRNEIINGVPDWVNEEEFGLYRSMVFTADSRQLVWVRYDERSVKEYAMPLYKGLKPEKAEYRDYPGSYAYKYPIAGEDNSRVTVWSYDIGSRQTRQLQVPVEADGYVPRLVACGSRAAAGPGRAAAGPGRAATKSQRTGPAAGQAAGKAAAGEEEVSQVAVMTLNRHQDHLRIYMVNPLSTLSRLVVEEKAASYVREEAISGIRITGRYILLPSDRDGWLHLYLYNHNGQLLRQVDKGPYEVSSVYGLDEQTGNVYYASHEVPGGAQTLRSATQQHVWVARANGKLHCLTPQAGWNDALFGTGYQHFIHTWSDLHTPPVTTLRDASGKQLATLADNHALADRLKDYDTATRQLFTLTTADGVELNGWMMTPHDFDATRQYPVVMYQYGGPGSQQVKDAWATGMAGQGGLLEHYLCQQGFVCVCVDGRGTGGRGADFEKCTYLKLGQLEARDQVEAALWLGRQPWADAGRIGIWGWSFGGFNTLMALSEGRPVFRSGIAIAPPTSWRYYDTIYTERYMRTPQENPSGYDDSPIARADRLHGALLLCHGMADDNVHFRNTAEYTEALVQADKDFRQLVYTNRNHSIYGGNTRQHLYRQCVQFFEDSLKR